MKHKTGELLLVSKLFSGRSILPQFSDGLWHNMVPHDIDETPIDKWFLDALTIGFAIAHGWLEQDHTWVRLTRDGKIELARMLETEKREKDGKS